MNCPVCSVTLNMTQRQGVEIDYCPKCRGVWLDRGELDKILERESGPVEAVPYSRDPKRHGFDDDDDYRRKRKKSIWHELFD